MSLHAGRETSCHGDVGVGGTEQLKKTINGMGSGRAATFLWLHPLSEASQSLAGVERAWSRPPLASRLICDLQLITTLADSFIY